MAYRRIRGIKGLVYEPEPNQRGSKHNCKDCFYCQWCSDNRCENCLKDKTRRKKKKVTRKKVTKKTKKKAKKKTKKKR